MPPILFMLGTKDNIIPVSTAERFRKTVQENDGRCDLKFHEGAGHGFFNSPPHIEAATQETIGFLRSIGWLHEAKSAP